MSTWRRAGYDLPPWLRARAQNGVFIFVTNDGVSITNGKYGGTVTRATAAYQFSHATGLYTSVSSGVDRCQHDVYSAGLAAWVTNTRLAGEPQRTNGALGSNLFADGTYWAGNASFTLASALSCISGQTATRHTPSVSFQSRYQAVGTFVNGQTDCAWIIIENDPTNPAYDSSILLYDNTAGATLGGVYFVWGTSALTPAGSPAAYGLDELGTGPNGGRLVRLWVTATGTAAGTGAAGHTRQAFTQPVNTLTGTMSAVIHHAQFEANALFPTTPIVTVAAAVTRNAEIVSVPLPTAVQSAQALAIYDKWVAQGGYLATTVGYRWNVGGSTAPLLSGQFNGSSQPTMTINNGTDAAITDTAPAVAPSWADLMETRGLLASTGTVQTGAAKNSGAETLAAASAAPAHGILVPWNANTVYLGSLGATAGGGQALVEFILAAGAPSMATFRGLI